MQRIRFPVFFIVFICLLENAESQDFVVRSDVISSINSSTVQKNIWSAFSNQACLAHIEEINAGISWENRFLLKELSIQKLAVSYPLSFGTTAFSFAKFGFENYNENSIGLAFGRKFGDKFSAGIQLNYLWRFIAENYGSKGILLLEFGLLSEPVDGITIGLHLFNPVFSGFKDFKKNSKSATYSLGVGLDRIPNLFAELEISGNIYYPVCVRFKLDYRILKNILLLAGVQTSPVGNFFGAGFISNNMRFDIGFCTHQVLGMSPRLCLSYGL